MTVKFIIIVTTHYDRGIYHNCDCCIYFHRQFPHLFFIDFSACTIVQESARVKKRFSGLHKEYFKGKGIECEKYPAQSRGLFWEENKADFFFEIEFLTKKSSYSASCVVFLGSLHFSLFGVSKHFNWSVYKPLITFLSLQGKRVEMFPCNITWVFPIG